MEQLIKKINMIDILGILIPGGLLLLLFEQDIHWVKCLTSLLGVGADKLLWVAIFLCGSYFVGMLLHELGSKVEKLLWMNPLSDPHIYAAITTNIVNCPEEANQAENPKETTLTAAKKFKRVVCFLCRLLCSIPACLILYLAAGQPNLCYFSLFLLILLIILIIPNISCIKQLYKVVKQSGWDKFYALSETEDEIGRKSVTSDEYERKRGLFNGYRSLARSMLILLAVIQLYITCCPPSTTSYLAKLHNDIYNAPELLFLQILTIFVLALRYCHFSYLRYTYFYNGYLYNQANPTQSESKDYVVHIMIRNISEEENAATRK